MICAHHQDRSHNCTFQHIQHKSSNWIKNFQINSSKKKPPPTPTPLHKKRQLLIFHNPDTDIVYHLTNSVRKLDICAISIEYYIRFGAYALSSHLNNIRTSDNWLTPGACRLTLSTTPRSYIILYYNIMSILFGVYTG